MLNSNLLAFWRANHRSVLTTALVLIFALSLPTFNLFEERGAFMLQLHLLLELFAVVVAFLIAVVSWHALENEHDPDAGILLTGFGTVAFMDLLHALTYEGMPQLITESYTHRAIFFWLAGRSLVLLTLLLVALRLRHALPRRYCLAIAATISAALFWVGSFNLDWIPTTYIPGMGVTPFKAYFEYALVTGYTLLALMLILRATPQVRRQSFALATSCLIMAMGEMVFANYKAPSDFLNSFGHVFKIVSYAILYQTVFVSAIRQPYQLMRQSEGRFRALTELSADWFWEQDANFRFTQVSPGLANTMAQSPVGFAPWELSGDIESDAGWNAHRQALGGHEAFKDFIYRLKTAAGAYRWVSTSGSPIFGERGEFLGYRGIASDITDRMASEEKITFLAYHDPLTGLPNRLLLQDRFEQASAHAAHAGNRLALLFLDLDNFKNINDTLGHDIGDALLKQIAARLKEVMRNTDTIGRQGGDEFLVVMTDFAKVDDIVPTLAKLVEALQQPFNANGHALTTSLSMGVAVFPEDGTTFDDLRKKADLAMYRAKDSGRNTYRFFDEAMNAEAISHMVMANNLRGGLERGEFMLYYQPQFDLASGAITGMEALIRWNHPELGMVSPANFIPAAEESGLIVPIGEWALHEACRQAMEWQRAGLSPLTVAVNLSAVQFKRDDIEQSVVNALQVSGLAPELLELELTESILIQNVEGVLTSIQRLKKLGVKLAIDDFGTGYSSLSYLKRFDIDKLKIDQSFVRDLATDEDDAAIVRAIIQMAQSLKLRTIAEGVETPEMLNKLRIFGCDEGQGYYFARPMPAAEICSFLSEQQQKITA